MTINVGDRMPSGVLMTMGAEGPAPVQTDELFGGKTVVLFGLPGAFTPTCSAQHVPGYVANHDALKAKGVDAIGCLSVNDPFVMGAWGKDQGVGDKVMMLADGSADYAKALGLELDLSARGMGMRATRFALLVEDGVVKSVAVEGNPGEVTSSGAEAILGQL
ncbi:MAG: peroxiredoxin [Alphaproteobacteria bacterium]|jgi:peroxiredoxin (alkyl hydroperoxide reductase subunit C)|nr:peroxiredoxin [Alphaproteobacteria bacterium]MDP6567335.1 peroxiredoxin [Alphaproteobacteria bacterium]MDP6812492.1 peroxiredoxin [Alphaproteobacteria bacterium]